MGVNFSNNLHWAKKLILLTTKAYRTVGLIRCTFKHIFTEARKQLYVSSVWSQLVYCSHSGVPNYYKTVTSDDHQLSSRTECLVRMLIIEQSQDFAQGRGNDIANIAWWGDKA